MNKKDWLLLAIGEGTLEPVQVQKLMFLFREKTAVSNKEAYEFVPYDWGPCSFEIYDDLDDLIALDLIARSQSPHGVSRYSLSEQGQKTEKNIRGLVDEALLGELLKLRRWVTSRPFRTLLLDVYKEFPQYSVASKLAP